MASKLAIERVRTRQWAVVEGHEGLTLMTNESAYPCAAFVVNYSHDSDEALMECAGVISREYGQDFPYVLENVKREAEVLASQASALSLLVSLDLDPMLCEEPVKQQSTDEMC